MELNVYQDLDICNFSWFDLQNVPVDVEFDLQRFSAESEGRTEKPSEHKKRKAREEGRAPLSKDLPSALVTIFCFVTIYFMGKYFFEVLFNNLQFIFANACSLSITEGNFYRELVLTPCLQLFIPVGVVAVIVAALSNYGQIGFKFTPKAIKPDFKKISPNIFKYFKNQVFSPTGFFNLFKSLVKVAIIGAVSFFIIYGQLTKLLFLLKESNILLSFIEICKICFQLIMISSIIMGIFSIVDVFFTRKQYEEQLKMKKEEVKQEYKELEGDPEVKAKLNQMYQDLMSQEKQLKNVPDADVVITNPTHFAVALRYDSKIDNAPKVIAKGQDNFAQKIKAVARENDIFLYENVPLARRLYAEVNIGQEIPSEVFSFVIVAYRLAAQYNATRQKESVDA